MTRRLVASAGVVFLAVAIYALSAAILGWEPALPTTATGHERTNELDEALDRHRLHLPAEASAISYDLHSSIDSDEVAVHFRTTPDGLSEFLDSRTSSSWLGVLVDRDHPAQPVVNAYSLSCC